MANPPIGNIPAPPIIQYGGPNNLSERINVSLPSVSGIGYGIGNEIGGTIKQGVLEFGRKTLDGLFDNKIIGPIANQIFGNLTYSLSDLMAKAEARKDPSFVIDWTIRLPFDEKINDHVEEIDLGLTALDFNPYQRAGRTINYASRKSTQPVRVTYYQDSHHTASRYIQTWRDMTANIDGTFNYPSFYKQDITVNAITPTKEFVGIYLLIGCFPIGNYTINYGSEHAERIRLVQEFAVDHIAFVPFA